MSDTPGFHALLAILWGTVASPLKAAFIKTFLSDATSGVGQ